MSRHKNAQQAIEYWTDALTIDEPWLGWEYSVNGWYLPDEEAGWIHMCGHHHFEDNCKYRRKQKTININGFEVPEPIRGELTRGQMYFVPRISDPDDPLWVTYYDLPSDISRIASGAVHLTAKAAILHAKALLSFTAKAEDK